MSYGLNAHVRSDRAKWWIVFLALLVVGAILCGLITNWFRDMNPFCWFGHNYDEADVCVRCGKDKPVDEPAEPEQSNGNVVLTPIASQYMQLNAAPVALADNPDTYTLEATITPASADDKRVEWTVGWKDSNAIWAIGKNVTDYVTVTPVSEHALTATIECAQDFGEQVIVTVKSLDNQEAKAQCTIDYVRRILDVNVNIPAIVNSTTPFTYDITYSNYTIAGELNISDATFDIWLYDELNEALYDLGDFYGNPVADQIQLTDSQDIAIDVDNPAIVLPELEVNDFGDGLPVNNVLDRLIRVSHDIIQSYDISNIVRCVRQVMEDNTKDFCLYCTFVTVYDGKVYSTSKVKQFCELDTSAIHIAVSNVNMSQGSIIV